MERVHSGYIIQALRDKRSHRVSVCDVCRTPSGDRERQGGEEAACREGRSQGGLTRALSSASLLTKLSVT